jgi:hypothetical protein
LNSFNKRKTKHKKRQNSKQTENNNNKKTKLCSFSFAGNFWSPARLAELHNLRLEARQLQKSPDRIHPLTQQQQRERVFHALKSMPGSQRFYDMTVWLL